MTAIPEAKLAKEAEMCYTMIAMPTDYDCWKETEEAVDVSMVVKYMKENNKTINELLPVILENISTEQNCSCSTASQYAILTNKDLIPEDIKKKLDIFIGKYLK